jgi:hypothetical protein
MTDQFIGRPENRLTQPARPWRKTATRIPANTRRKTSIAYKKIAARLTTSVAMLAATSARRANDAWA